MALGTDGPDLEVFVTEGLGDNSYLLWSGNEAVLVDPQRDVRRFLRAAEERGVNIRYVLETHVHNDYVSGALEVRAVTDAEIAAPAEGGYAFPIRPVRDGDDLPLGRLVLRAMATPGHTFEHLSYLVLDRSDVPLAVFTGGSLMVGNAGRSDLLGQHRADQLARAQFRSLRTLARLPQEVKVLPTHGTGSFCGAGSASEDRTSTIGRERRSNPALSETDEETFVRRHLSDLLAYPRYYQHMAGINRAGPQVLRSPPRPARLTAGELEGLRQRGAWVVDGRDRRTFAEAHIPGSINVELGATFGSYVGWVVPFGSALALVLPPDDDAPEEALTQLLRIGYDGIKGYLGGGMRAWASDSRPISSYRVVDVDDLCRATARGDPIQVLDVRQQIERNRASIPGSLHVFVGDLARRVDEVPRERPVWTVCATGQRAAVAASLLDREAVPVTVVSGGGVEEWAAHCGQSGVPGA